MKRYRKIDPRIWKDEKFQEVWAAKWDKPVHIPSLWDERFWHSRWAGWKDHPEAETFRKELSAMALRRRFSKVKKIIFPIIYQKFKKRCVSCKSRENLFLDHIIPICWGGTNALANFQLLCLRCNSLKSGILPEPPPENYRGL